MKTMLSVSIDTEIVALCRLRYDNISGKIEGLLRADLNAPGTESLKDLKRETLMTEVSISKAKVAELEKALKDLEVKKVEEEKNVRYI